MESHKFLSENFGLLHLAKYAGVDTSGPVISPDDFLGLFSRIMMYSAVTNVLALLSQSKNNSSLLSLPLKISSYQHAIYFNCIKRYEFLDKYEKSIVKSIQELYTAEMKSQLVVDKKPKIELKEPQQPLQEDDKLLECSSSESSVEGDTFGEALLLQDKKKSLKKMFMKIKGPSS